MKNQTKVLGLLFGALLTAMLALSGCGGGNPAAGGVGGTGGGAPSANQTNINKYTITGTTIAASPNNPFVNVISVANFTSATKATLITVTQTAASSTPTFNENVTVSANSQYPAYQSPIQMPQRQMMQSPTPLTAEAAIRARERQLLTSINPTVARSAFQQSRLQAPMAPNALTTSASLGATQNFNVADITTGNNQVVNATCQFVGNSAYIFVDNAIVGGAGTTYASGSAQLQAISTAFDAIYATDRSTFGSEWGGAAPGDGSGGIDGDPKIYILISPAVNTNGSNGVLGYFWGGDEFPRTVIPTSNQHEMFYVVNRAQGAGVDLWADANQASHPNSATGYNILAHEFQHMINFNIKSGHNGLYNGVLEDTWLNEALSMYAMQACGYGLTNANYPDPTTANHVFNYLSNPSGYSLTNWTPANYGLSYLFMLYLVEHYGGGVGSAQSKTMLQAMESNSSVGIANVETQTGVGTFGTVFKNWAMANLLDKVTTTPAYNYTSINLHGTYAGVTLPGIVPYSFSTYPQALKANQLGWSALYQQFTGGTNNALNISVQSSSASNNLEGILVVW